MRQPFPPYHHTVPQQYSTSCPSGTPQAQQTEGYDYPQYDQNVYQYGENYEYGYPSPQSPEASYYQPQGMLSGWFDFSNPCYLKGFVAGAAITFLVTNSTVQRAIVRGAVNLMSVVQGGVEEVKEQIKDVKAEMSQKEE